jgi:hypothetical protein
VTAVEAIHRPTTEEMEQMGMDELRELYAGWVGEIPHPRSNKRTLVARILNHPPTSSTVPAAE